MIRPLRRRHRWMISTLFLLLVIATVLAAGASGAFGACGRLPPADRQR